MNEETQIQIIELMDDGATLESSADSKDWLKLQKKQPSSMRVY